MLKLKLQYFGHLIQRVDSVEKILMLGKTEDRRSEQQRMRWLDEMNQWLIDQLADSMDTSLRKLLEIVKDREA